MFGTTSSAPAMLWDPPITATVSSTVKPSSPNRERMSWTLSKGSGTKRFGAAAFGGARPMKNGMRGAPLHCTRLTAPASWMKSPAETTSACLRRNGPRASRTSSIPVLAWKVNSVSLKTAIEPSAPPPLSLYSLEDEIEYFPQRHVPKSRRDSNSVVEEKTESSVSLIIWYEDPARHRGRKIH